MFEGKDLRKITQFDKKFLISQIAIVILCVLRVAKWGKNKHAARLMILDDYSLSIVMTLVMFIALFVMFMISIKFNDVSNRNKVFYVIMMISVMLYPTYVHDNYLGAMDIYGITLGAIVLIMVMINKCEWISVILMAIGIFINPMCIFSLGVVVPVLVLYKGFVKKNKKELIICLCLCVVEVITFFISRKLGMFNLDVVDILDYKKLIVIMIFLTPFIFTAVVMFYNMIKKSSNVEGKLYYIISAFVGAPGFIVWTVSGDYTRAIINLFICYGLWLIVMMSYKDELLTSQINEECKIIKKWVPINGVVVLYVAAIMIYWMCGIEEVDTEVMLELVVK